MSKLEVSGILLLIAAPFFIAHMIARLGIVKFSGSVILLGIVIQLYNLGIIQEGLFWFLTDGRLIPTFCAICGATLIASLSIWWYRRDQFLSLRWPKSMDWALYERWCLSYLGMKGWETSTQVPRGPLSFFAKKGKMRLGIICHTGTLGLDLVKRAKRIQNAVIVSHGAVPFNVCEEAALLGVRVLHYVQLDQFDELLSSPIVPPNHPDGSSESIDKNAAWNMLRDAQQHGVLLDEQ
jgi:hypothetical protein